MRCPESKPKASVTRRTCGQRKVVEDVPSIASIFNESGFPQDHQVLRNVGLPQSKNCLQVTHTLLAVPENIQNCDTNRMAYGPARVRLGLIVFRDIRWGSHHIQNPEYDFMARRPSRVSVKYHARCVTNRRNRKMAR